MAGFIIRGEIIPFSAQRRNIRVHNDAALRQFWADERIDTKLDWDRSKVLIALNIQRLVNRCEIGDIVDYLIETRDQANGRRIRGVALEVVTRANP
jgi:hypothetical protein